VGRLEPKAVVPADVAVITGSLPEGSCSRAAGVGNPVIDTAVAEKKDTDVGQLC
jgi:hypothetical protein